MKQEIASRPHQATVRVLPHIKKLDDCFSQFLVGVICDCARCVRSSRKPWRALLAGRRPLRISRCGSAARRCKIPQRGSGEAQAARSP